MDTTDDAWSYSYPSSLDSLPLPPVSDSTNTNDKEDEVASNLEKSDKSQNGSKTELKIVTEQPKETKLESPIALRRGSDNAASATSISPPKSSIMSAPQPALISRHRNSTSMSQNGAVKSAPADPHTTKHDVESMPANNSSASSINDPAADLAMIQNQSPPSTPVQTGNFFNNMFSSISFSKQGNNAKPSNSSNTYDENGVMTIAVGNHSRTNSNGNSVKDSTPSPNILSYRRNKKSKRRNTSLSSLESPKSPLVQGEKPILSTQEEESPKAQPFNEKNYVDEKFKDTAYRYASVNRNQEFHKLFKSIPPEERLLDDFSCALSREILLQGRLYLTEKNLCFNSNLLGWVTNLVIPYNDVRSFEKTATAGLFPNGIAIQLNNGHKHYFASFLSRDSTYNQISEIWEASDDQVHNLTQVNTNSFQNTDGEPLVSKDLTLDLEKYDTEEYQEALLSIDGDGSKRNTSGSDGSGNDDDEYNESDDSSASETKYRKDGDDIGKVISSSEQTVYKLRDTSVYAYNGPDGHQRTVSNFDSAGEKEVILAEENIKCPPGLLFEILFGPNNDLTLQFLGAQGSSDFSKFSDYERNDEGKKERSYNYVKALNYSIGPKSTKCYVQETIESLDYNSVINVISTTKTPDVPSGNAFNVKTRYVMTWGANNTTDLVVSFKVDWTGTSWVKSMIDKSCLSGQEEATKVLIPLVKKVVHENTFETTEEVKIENNVEPIANAQLKSIDSKAKGIQSETTSNVPGSFLFGLPAFNTIALGLLLLILIFQISIYRSIGNIPEKAFSFGLLNNIDQEAERAIFKGEELLLWNWIDERAGKLDLSKNEKIGVLKNDIDQLINRWVNDELNTKESKKLIKTFEHHLNSYSESTFNNLEDNHRQKRAESLKAAIRALL